MPIVELESGEIICRKPGCFVRPHVEMGDEVEGWECPGGCVVNRVIKGPNGGITIVVRRIAECKKTPDPGGLAWPRKRK